MSEPNGKDVMGMAAAITPLGYIDHSDYAEKGVKLAYGEQPDATLIKVDLLGSEPPPLICPLCRTSIHKVRSKTGRLFFRHTSNAPGCGGPETNAHIWAKAQLLEAKEIWLPAVLSKFPQVMATLQNAKMFRFVDVLIEPLRGDLRPDLVVVVTNRQGETRELWIEIHVTHKCGPAKRAKIEARTQAAIEIDLSAFRTSHDAPAIREALLHGDDNRVWLYHKAIDEDFAARTNAAKLAEAQAQARLRAKAERLVAAFQLARVKMPSSALETVIGKINGLGLLEVVGVEGPRAGFLVSETAWQAVIWNSLVVSRLEADQTERPLNTFAALDAVADCLPSALRQPLSPEVLDAARIIESRFVAPQEAIERYFSVLKQHGEMWADHNGVWHVGHDRSNAVYRKIEHFRCVSDRIRRITKRVNDLLALLPEPPLAFDVAAWLDIACLGGQTPRQMIEGREEVWGNLDKALQAIERMPAGRPPVDDLLGLPVEPLKAAAEAHQRMATDAAILFQAQQEDEAVQDRWWPSLAELGRQVSKFYDDVRRKLWMNGLHP